MWIEARSSLHPIHAQTSGLEGWLEADILGGGRINPSVPPRAHLDLEIELLSSGNALYDREMRRRVDARKYPNISGELTAMKEGDGDGEYSVSGEVTVRGQTHSYTDEMSLSVLGERDRVLRLEGSHEFDVRDFGIQPPKILSFRVFPEVAVRVVVVACEVACVDAAVAAAAVARPTRRRGAA